MLYAKFSLLYISTNKVAYSQPHPNKGTCSATNPYKILMYYSLKVFQCHLNSCSFDLCWFVFAGWCLFALVQPRVPSVYAHSPLFALVEPHVLSIHARSTFVSLLVCICGWCSFDLVCPLFVPFHACLHLFSLACCQFALV